MLHEDFDNFVNKNSINVLIVEDNLADVRVLKETLKDNNVRINLFVAEDGEQAILFLKREGKYNDALEPDLILLDLTLPKKDGFEVLNDVKNDPKLMHIPVIIVTVSQQHLDIVKSYSLRANAYVIKPIDINEFIFAIKSLKTFWFTIVSLPPRDN